LGRFEPGGKYYSLVQAGARHVVVDLRAPQAPVRHITSQPHLITVTFTADFNEATLYVEDQPPVSVRVGG
jgi:hypothetical protein